MSKSIMWLGAAAAILALAACEKDAEHQRKSAVAAAFGDASGDSAPTCDVASLKLSAPEQDRAKGVITFTLTNSGAQACGYDGFPVVNFGTVLNPAPIRLQKTSDDAHRVILTPGGTAHFTITYVAGSSPCMKPSPTTVVLGGRPDKAFKVEPAPTVCGDRVHMSPVMGRAATY